MCAYVAKVGFSSQWDYILATINQPKTTELIMIRLWSINPIYNFNAQLSFCNRCLFMCLQCSWHHCIIVYIKNFVYAYAKYLQWYNLCKLLVFKLICSYSTMKYKKVLYENNTRTRNVIIQITLMKERKAVKIRKFIPVILKQSAKPDIPMWQWGYSL